MSATATENPPARRSGLGQRVRQALVEELTRTVSGATAAFVFNVKGVPVTELETLRRSLKTVSADIEVVKHSLGKRLFAQVGWTGLASYFEGTSGVTLTTADPVAVSKVLVTFAKEHEGFTLRGGIVEGQALALEGIRALAALPSREVLLAKLVGSLVAPLSGFVGVLSGVPRQFVYVMDAIRQSKESKKEAT